MADRIGCSCVTCPQAMPLWFSIFRANAWANRERSFPARKTNAHLGTEYLAALETDNSTPYFLNLHNGEVARTLILGMTGSGKSFLRRYQPLRLPPKQMELSLSA